MLVSKLGEMGYRIFSLCVKPFIPSYYTLKRYFNSEILKINLTAPI